ncbi:glutamate 5-kinase [Daldinia loculata]|uniref:glutamate 5-kinase n=1 Tax=Daldinia loculata TaxID=103429 RepID=UPI0020C36E21|nr:glutamate 5-kinase [Daldinia loculata]KAI1646163.1 glutamate 5-kinase [Daldinia loculata]
MADPGGPTTPYMKGPKPLIVVIKLGTSSIVDEKTHEPLLSILTLIVETAVKLRKDGHKVIIVSSGAIGVGLQRMDIDKRPKHLSKLRALAAIGQCRLMSLWDSLFGHLRQPISQILLTRNDIADRTKYLNAQNTVLELLEMGVIPIVNENDTLAVAEIKFGDNDTLSAITAAMVHANFLFLMTDVDCLYDKNPRTNPDAKPIEVVEDIGEIRADVSSAGSSLGTGGMSTKIVAARLATSAGVTTVITRSSSPGNIVKIVRYLQASKKCTSSVHTPVVDDDAEDPLSRSTVSLSLNELEKPPLHTRFLPLSQPIRDRYFWILHGLAPHGTIYIDVGAHRALSDKAGLLPVGVLDVEGNFAQHEAVRIVVVERRSEPGPDGKIWEGPGVEIGRALVNYAAPEIARIKGHRSTQIETLLGYADSEYIADRDSISLLRRESRPVTPVFDKLNENGGVAAYENDISL